MLLLDLTHTAHTGSRTGIQRVTRALWTELGSEGLPVCRDPFLDSWRVLEPWETANLAVPTPAAGRSVKWPLRARIRGRLRRLAGSGRRTGCVGLPAAAQGLIVPELFSSGVARALPAIFSAVSGPRVALFYDATPLTHPELTPPGMVARFPAYLQDLLLFDGIAAISGESRDALAGYWSWLGVRGHPPVVAIPLGLAGPGSAAGMARDAAGSPQARTVLCVGTIEGRKNHLALLDACESLWARGFVFNLRLAGLAQRETGRDALDRISSLKLAGRPVRYDGPVDDAELEAAYAACTFTVYPSLAEGFGLPVLESLARGKPCICLGRGALGEAARGGGCATLGSVDAASLAAGIAGLLDNPAEVARLGAEARARSFKGWGDYVRELAAWMGSLPTPR
jgi:glycosyltransferase involved in cell wall biosynthesis